MPDGATHFVLGLAGGAALLWATASYAPHDLRPVAIGTGIGLIVTPDLDQERVKTFTEDLLYGLHWTIGILFEVNWMPYGAAFKHRGLSHHFIAGTLGRIIWTAFLMLFWATLAIGVQWLATSNPVNWVEQAVMPLWQQAHVSLFFAWWLQDLLHILADLLVSEIKSTF